MYGFLGNYSNFSRMIYLKNQVNCTFSDIVERTRYNLKALDNEYRYVK